MNDNSTFFDLDTNTLHEKAKRDVYEFVRNPNDDNLLNALFVLHHLREWIYPEGHAAYQRKPAEQYSREEKFHNELHNDPDYCMVRDLCNQAKHVRIVTSTETRVLHGLIPGYARAGDHLGQRNYIVDNNDVRDAMERLLERYNAYFKKS